MNGNLYIHFESGLYYLARRPSAESSRSLGTVVAFTPSGFVTVRCAGSSIAPEGSGVREAEGRLEGRVVRVFGPVARPYLLVRPRRLPSPVDGAALVGSQVLAA